MQQDDRHRTKTPAGDALHESITSLLRSLTVVLACTQLLQRHEDVTPELVDSRVAMIEAAATDMIKTLRHLEDLYSPERD